MKTRSILPLGGTLLLLGLAAGLAPKPWFARDDSARQADGRQQPTRQCPVCGMFVDRHTAWLASIAFADGRQVWFDGAKDLFKYYLYIHRYSPGRSTNEIRSVKVTEYYSVHLVDGRRSHYVVGSDVLGPMGHELVPFATEEAAREFLRDHHGRRVVTFHEVTRETIALLE